MQYQEAREEVVMQKVASLQKYGFAIGARITQKNLPQFLECIRWLSSKKLSVKRLRASGFGELSANSLTSRYGLGAFPPHTDFATYDNPPEYIGLFCPVNRNGVTLLYDTNHDAYSINEVDRSALFRVLNGRHRFLSRFSTRVGSRHQIRYNGDCMEPVDANSLAVQKKVSMWHPTATVDWSKTSWLIIDNWRILHARGPVSEIQPGWLWRISW
jgi:hypothetical protein